MPLNASFPIARFDRLLNHVRDPSMRGSPAPDRCGSTVRRDNRGRKGHFFDCWY